MEGPSADLVVGGLLSVAGLGLVDWYGVPVLFTVSWGLDQRSRARDGLSGSGGGARILVDLFNLVLEVSQFVVVSGQGQAFLRRHRFRVRSMGAWGGRTLDL